MKIFILNSSGNVGKSLLARELFYPRLKDAKIIEIETVNSGSSNFENLNIQKFKADDDFMEIYSEIITNDNIILDVGASNLAKFWDETSKFAGVDSLFDLFIIPTGARGKLQEDTYKTIRFLRSEGIDDSKIRVVFNAVEGSVESDFEVLLSTDFPYDTDLYIEKNESLFNDLGFLKLTIADIYNPDADGYKEQILNATDPREKIRLLKMDLANRQAIKVKERMDEVFEGATGIPAEWIGGSKDEKPKAKAKAKKKVEVEEDEEDL